MTGPGKVLVLLAFLAGIVAGCTGMAAGRSHAQSTEAEQAIAWAADAQGVPAAVLVHIAYCETRLLPWKTNPQSGAAGLFQFLPGTWAYASAGVGLVGASPYDPWAASLAAAWLYRQPRGPGHWRACL